MRRPRLHVPNVFDVLSPLGAGVNGYLKVKCIQVQNRVVSMADPGDFVAISDDCPQAFVDYIFRLINARDAKVLRFWVSLDLRKYLNARTMFGELAKASSWTKVLEVNPTFYPYMKSAAIYQAARDAGVKIQRSTWKITVTDHIPQDMNDKATLYRECDRLGLAVPQHWIAKGQELTELAFELLKSKVESLYVRQARSGGAFGNLTIERIRSKYRIREIGHNSLSQSEAERELNRFIRESFWDEFVVTELLDLYASPGSLFHVEDAGVKLICHTYQMLNRSRRYLGFMHPIIDEKVNRHFTEMEESMRKVIEPWWKMGFRGYGNIDWMVTRDDRLYIAELNARQTAVVPSVKIENKLSHPEATGEFVTTPTLSIFTIERIYFEQPITFDDIYNQLKEAKLLWGQGKGDGGVVITVPPSLPFGINSTGLMAVGTDIRTAYRVHNRALRELHSKESNLLFEPKI